MCMLADEVRQFLAERKIFLNTDLGQHFLIAEEVLDVILAAGDVQQDDLVVEIGPGIGILTRELLARAKTVRAVEIDARMSALLPQFVGGKYKERLQVMTENALHTVLPTTAYKVIANIPYHITSPLLRHLLLESPLRPTSMTLLIQREVAENICGQGSDGLLTILVQLFGAPSVLAVVPPQAFLPPPKVDSAVLQIDTFAQPKADANTVQRVLSLAKHAFSQKRKMLSNTVGKLPRGPEALEKCGILHTRRPQTLGIDEWIALAHALSATA